MLLEVSRFLVHREQIAKQALQTFQKVFGSTVKFGLLSGNSKDMNYHKGMHLMSQWKKTLRDEYQVDATATAASNVANILMNEFPAGSGKKTYADV